MNSELPEAAISILRRSTPLRRLVFAAPVRNDPHLETGGNSLRWIEELFVFLVLFRDSYK